MAENRVPNSSKFKSLYGPRTDYGYYGSGNKVFFEAGYVKCEIETLADGYYVTCRQSPPSHHNSFTSKDKAKEFIDSYLYETKTYEGLTSHYAPAVKEMLETIFAKVVKEPEMRDKIDSRL